MAKLNEKNKITEKIIHLMVTPLCDRKCPHCCNNQYDFDEIQHITNEELLNTEILFLTGGEPFQYSNPNAIARYYKIKYPNIKKIIVYTNAFELAYYLQNGGDLEYIDGVNVSLKNLTDKFVFESVINNHNQVKKLTDNRIYAFPGTEDVIFDKEHYEKYNRKWQVEFIPASDSIFRKL